MRGAIVLGWVWHQNNAQPLQDIKANQEDSQLKYARHVFVTLPSHTICTHTGVCFELAVSVLNGLREFSHLVQLPACNAFAHSS